MTTTTKPTKTAFRRMVAAATKEAGYGRGYRKELTLWPARAGWPTPESPTDGDVDAACDDLGWSDDDVYERWDGRRVIEVYVSARYGPVEWGEWELCDNVEIDPVAMEWSATGQPWRPLEIDA